MLPIWDNWTIALCFKKAVRRGHNNVALFYQLFQKDFERRMHCMQWSCDSSSAERLTAVNGVSHCPIACVFFHDISSYRTKLPNTSYTNMECQVIVDIVTAVNLYSLARSTSGDTARFSTKYLPVTIVLTHWIERAAYNPNYNVRCGPCFVEVCRAGWGLSDA